MNTNVPVNDQTFFAVFASIELPTSKVMSSKVAMGGERVFERKVFVKCHKKRHF